MSAYYNEIDTYCVRWLRNLISAGLIAPGDVDPRPIQEVQPDDLAGYSQVHLFAGIGGWSLALRLAGWPDDRPVWTGSCPCQPFSVAGRRKGFADDRHLWPHFYRLIRGSRPIHILGEQVAGAAGYAWLHGVASDLEAEGYAWGAVDIPACAVNAPQRRNRLYWVASAYRAGLEERQSERRDPRAECPSVERGGGEDGGLGGSSVFRCERMPEGAASPNLRPQSASDGWQRRTELQSPRTGGEGFWDDYALIGPDPDGRYRRIKPGIAPLVARLPEHVDQIRAYGNAINPELAAEVIRAWLDTEGRYPVCREHE